MILSIADNLDMSRVLPKAANDCSSESHLWLVQATEHTERLGARAHSNFAQMLQGKQGKSEGSSTWSEGLPLISHSAASMVVFLASSIC
jgi:hypothetical protein